MFEEKRKGYTALNPTADGLIPMELSRKAFIPLIARSAAGRR